MVTLKLLALLAAHLVMTGLPGAAGALLAARRGVRNASVLIAVGLATSGSLAMLTFWSYYASQLVGDVVAFGAVAGSIVAVTSSLRGDYVPPSLRRQLLTPMVLWILSSCFLVFLGFVHGGSSTPILVGSTRFSYPLPSDSQIPMFFAEWFYAHGHHGPPPVFPGVWLASDRPPLQIGYVLTQRAIAWDNVGLNYQLLAVVLQQLWVFGAWALLLAARVGRVTRALTVLAILVSDLAIVNGFFVWPKMLPAAMLLAAAALLITPLWSDVRRSLWGAALVAVLMALALLGHGSSLFGIIPLLLVAAFRGLPRLRWLLIGALAAIVLLAPWSAYQRYGDPPGNRLAKWAFAGDIGPDNKSTLQAVVDAYKSAGVGGTLHDKAENFATIFGGAPAIALLKAAVHAPSASTAALDLRSTLFFYLVPSFGLLLIVPFIMLARLRHHARNDAEWRFALSCYLTLAIGEILFGLLLFGNVTDLAVIHEGSYALPLLGFCAGVAGVRSVLPRFGIFLVLLNAALMLALYVPALTPPPGTSYSAAAVIIALASLAGFGAVALRSDDAARHVEAPRVLAAAA